MICATPTVDLRRYGRQLWYKHERQIARVSDAELQNRAELVALTFRPGDRTSSFFGKTFRPLGSSVGVVLSYADDGSAMTVAGFRAQVRPNGDVGYGVNHQRDFQYDARRLTRGGRRNELPILRNPSLGDLTLRMDAACARRANVPLPEIPVLPKIYLGFAPNDLPVYEATPGLKRVVAKQIGISLEQLEGNPPAIVEPLLRANWDALMNSAAVDPATGLVLLDAEICSLNGRPLRAYEDFSALIGDWTWNPVRDIDLPRLPNPAYQILNQYGIDPKDGFEQPIPQVRLEAMVADFRAAVGEAAHAMDEEDVYDALVTPDEQLLASSAAVPLMRKRLTSYWSECSTDQDLRIAARRPHEPLFASGACRVQVLRQRVVREPLKFTGAELGRRIEADWTPIVWNNRTP